MTYIVLGGAFNSTHLLTAWTAVSAVFFYETATNLQPTQNNAFFCWDTKSEQLLKINVELAKITVSSSSSGINSDILIY